MKTREQLKNAAKKHLKDNWVTLAIIVVLCGVAASVVGSPFYFFPGIILFRNMFFSFFLGLIPLAGMFLVVTPLAYSVINISLKITEKKKFDIEDVLFAFKDKERYIKVVKTGVMIGIKVFLYSLLLVIPGIIKALEYSQTFFVLRDNPKMEIDKAMEKSKQMMDGMKLDYIVLGLSFLGWMILAAIPAGLGFIILTPYMQMTYTEFYLNIKKRA